MYIPRANDNKDASTSLAELLDWYGHEMRTVANGPAAMKIAAQFHPQLVLSDIGVPGMEGYALAPGLCSLAGERRMVQAAVTGYRQPGNRKQAFRADFDHHLVKPLLAETLLKFVEEQALSIRGALQLEVERLRAMLAHAQKVADLEKLQLARTLQHEFGSALTALAIRLAILTPQPSDAPDAAEQWSRTNAVLATLTGVARRIQRDLRPVRSTQWG